MKKTLFLLFSLLILFSCNDHQKKAQALKDLQLSEEVHTNVQKQINELEQQIVKLTSELEVAKDNINQVKEFKFLRSESKREQQIREATEYKIKIERSIDNVRNQIVSLNDSLLITDTKIHTLKQFLTN